MYNCVEYIERCIQSVYKQGMDESDFEIVVVNDGSTDGGEKLVEDLMRQYGNIYLVAHQENKGLPAARNTGIAASHGKYLQFLDADDYLAEGYIGRLLRIAIDDDLEIITFASKQVYDDKPEADTVQEEETVSPLMTGIEAEEQGLLSTAWFYLLKRELIDRFDLRFPEQLRYGEDTPFLIEIFYHATRVKMTNYLAHRYQMRQSSMCRTDDPARKLQRIRGYKEAMVFLNDTNERYKDRSRSGYEMMRQLINLHIFFYLYGTLTVNISTKELKDSISELKGCGLYPVGTFERLGYKGVKHSLLRWLANSRCLFLLTHRIIHAIR